MAGRKCPICKQFDDPEEMTQLPNKRFVHTEKCLDIHNEREEKQKQENIEWSNLFEYIKELHGIIAIPTRNIKRLHQLRDGNDIVNGKTEKRYKQGPSYGLMLEAYKLQEDKIKWFISSVLNDGKDASDINKCISMMLNGLNTAWQVRQTKIKLEKQIKNELSKTFEKDMSFPDATNIKKRRDDGDISHLL
ncbi:hypothetical protein ACFQZE_06570 [Paenibacillus sp. GCM10027627]|uniref:hypothetical protein n=1 Tax=unclassified Paenibacillus TaxID=185978 RepID=UPI003631CB64